METAIVSSLTTVAEQVTNSFGEIAPVAMTVMGTVMVWKLGIRFFKSVARG